MCKVKEIKEILINKVYDTVEDNLDNVCVEELGEVIDMIKDLSETLYYHKLVEAMEESPKDAMKYIYPSVATSHIEKEVTHKTE